MAKTRANDQGEECLKNSARSFGSGNYGLDVVPISNTTLVSVTPVLDTSAYATADLMANATAISDCLDDMRKTGILHSVQVLDASDQALAFDILILDQSISAGTLNNAFSPSDADMANCLGAIEIATTDYVDCANSQIAFKGNLGMVVKSSTTALYFVLVSRGAGTYAADGIKIKFGVLSD